MDVVMRDEPTAEGGRSRVSGRQLCPLLADDGWLDELLAGADDGGVAFDRGRRLPPRADQGGARARSGDRADVSFGLDKGDQAGVGSPNSRNGRRRRWRTARSGLIPLTSVDSKRTTTSSARRARPGYRDRGADQRGLGTSRALCTRIGHVAFRRCGSR